MKITWYTNIRLAWFGLNSWKRKLLLPRSTKGSPMSRVLWTDAYFLLKPSAHTEEQSAALHLTYTSGCKDYLEQMLNMEQMLNIKNAQWIIASFSLAEMRHILSLFSQLSAPQAMLMHRLEHFPSGWRIRILCSNLGTHLVNGLCALFVCCSILATLWSLSELGGRSK